MRSCDAGAGDFCHLSVEGLQEKRLGEGRDKITHMIDPQAGCREAVVVHNRGCRRQRKTRMLKVCTVALTPRGLVDRGTLARGCQPEGGESASRSNKYGTVAWRRHGDMEAWSTSNLRYKGPVQSKPRKPLPFAPSPANQVSLRGAPYPNSRSDKVKSFRVFSTSHLLAIYAISQGDSAPSGGLR